MPVNITERQMPYKYGKYVIDMDRARQELKQAGKGNATVTRNDALDISKAGRNALENAKDAGKISLISSFSVMDDFEKMVTDRKEKGVKRDTFDFHASQMASAYKQMKDDIEKKYAGMDREQQYYIDDDGSIQELTREKELEMLDKAYEKHSRFMATSTEIWNSLQSFKPQVQPGNNGDTSKDSIKTQAFHAFMSALDNENAGLLPQPGKSLKNIKLNLNIPDAVRNELNRIWDWQGRLY